MLGVEGLRGVLGGLLVDGVGPPHVAALDPVHLGIVVGAAHHEDLLDGFRRVVAGAQRLVDLSLQRRRLTAPVLAVGGDDEFGLGVVDAGAQGTRGEPGENHRVSQAEAGAGEHRDEGFGDHRHVDGHPVAGFEADRGEVVGRLGHLVLELGVGQVAVIAGLADPVDRDPVTLARIDMAIHTVVGDVEFAADEPLGERGIRPVENLIEIGVPVEAAGLLGPELEPVGVGAIVEFGGRVGLRGELVGRRVGLGGGWLCGGRHGTGVCLSLSTTVGDSCDGDPL